MKTALPDLQIAVYKKLSQYTPLQDKVNGVYTGVPSNAVLPYVNVGNPTAIRDDNKNREGEELTRTIHVWVEKSEYETVQIMSLVLQALTDGPMTINGYNVWKIEPEFTDVQDDPEGYKHGVMRVRFYIQH